MDKVSSPGDKRDAAARALDDRVRDYIANANPKDDAFERLALDTFAYQYERNAPYRQYCDRYGRTPDGVRSWRDVPAVPAQSFAAVRLACFAPDRTVLKFVSSGTTSGGQKASSLELDAPVLYDASLLEHFRARVLPDRASMRLVALAPSFEEAPRSSLSYMLGKIDGALGRPGGAYFIRSGQLLFDDLCAALGDAAEPLLVFGTAFAFVHFFDRCREAGVRFALPFGSRVVETGGFKGKSREVPRAELYESFTELLGVPRVFCTSEYGMCELGSQWYDANIDDYFGGSRPRTDVKAGPRWARATIVDPVTAEPVAEGRQGLLQLFDLSNRGSVAAILTADVAREKEGGFELLGRFAGAPPKGCSIAADALLHAADG